MNGNFIISYTYFNEKGWCIVKYWNGKCFIEQHTPTVFSPFDYFIQKWAVIDFLGYDEYAKNVVIDEVDETGKWVASVENPRMRLESVQQ